MVVINIHIKVDIGKEYIKVFFCVFVFLWQLKFMDALVVVTVVFLCVCVWLL